jgi:hypothetical protein
MVYGDLKTASLRLEEYQRKEQERFNKSYGPFIKLGVIIVVSIITSLITILLS